jgi:uncharacterized membrane protein YheB (UPF0754 family)
MRVNDHGEFDKSAFYYWSKLFRSIYMGPGDETRKTINIHMMTLNRFKKEENCHFQVFLESPIMRDELSEEFDIHFIVLEKFIKTVDKLKSKLDYWMYFLAIVDKCEGDMMPGIFKTHEGLQDVYKALQNLELDPSEEEIYEKQLKKLRDRQDELGKNSLEMEIEKVASSFNSSNFKKN